MLGAAARIGLADLANMHNEMTDAFAFQAMSMSLLPTAKQRANAFITQLPRELRKIRREYIATSRADPDAGKLEAVTVTGNAERDAKLGYFRAQLVDGTWGALQRRPDDCLQAAIATFLETPAHTVPDLKLGRLKAAGKDPEQIERVILEVMGAWIEKNAVTIRAHAAQLPTTSHRWIGATVCSCRRVK